MDYLSITRQYWIENQDKCLEKLNDEAFRNTIPLLNTSDLDQLTDKCLVRFRGMIQDVRNPEFYYEKFMVENEITKETVLKCGKFQDSADLKENEVIQFSNEQNVTEERQTLVVITFPGQNNWVHTTEKEHKKILNLSTVKSPNKSLKRALDPEEAMETENNDVDSDERKRKCTNSNTENPTMIVSKESFLNFPLPDADGKCCLIKVYNNTSEFKLNQMVEVVGFLSIDPTLTNPSYHNEEHDSDMEIQIHNPPPSLIPRIHCVQLKNIGFYNPLMQNLSLNKDNIVYLKGELNLILTQLLFGDKLAADYLTYHLISRVYLRREGMALGKFSLNISNIPTDKHLNFGSQLYEFLQLFLAKSHYLPLTLENMNDLTFIPKKDYECNRLTSGLLQLSNNTHLVLDETKLQPGQLKAAGCCGITALASVIQKQKVNYDFVYYHLEFDCDIPVLTLSEGTSLLPSDVHLPLIPDENYVETFPEITVAAKQFLKPDLLNNLRVYLTQVRHGNYDLSDNVMELVQNEFVKLRQSNNITSDDLHQLLVLTRLICLSKGKECLDEECWQEACKLEVERKARIINPRR